MNPPTGTLIFGSNNNVNAGSINVTDVLMRVYGFSGQGATEYAPMMHDRHELELARWKLTEKEAALLGTGAGERPKTMWEQMLGHIQQFHSEPGVCNAMVALFINRLLHNQGSIEDAWPTEAETDWLAQRLQRLQKEYQLESMKLKVQNAALDRADRLKKATNRMMKSPERASEGLKFELRYQVLMDKHAMAPAAMPWDEIFRNVRQWKFCLLSIYVSNQGHSMALAGQNGKWYLLDPNYGLYRYGVSSQMRDDLKRLLTEYKTTGFGLFAPKVTDGN
jgi:hypothetical protein